MGGTVKRVSLILEAQTELQDSVSFYRDQAGDQLAEAFKAEVKAGLQTLSEDPERSPHLGDIPVDALYSLAHQFQGGPPPPAPYPLCGVEPDLSSTMGCLYSACA